MNRSAFVRMARLSVLVLVLSVFLGYTGRSAYGRSDRGSLTQASMVLDWYPNSDHGGVFVAIQKEFFRGHGIAMTPRVPPGATSQIQLVAAGRADFGITYETDLLAARAQGIPVRSVMCIMQHPLDTVMSLQRTGIKRPHDLIGKRIGMAGSPSDKPIVAAMMTHDHASIAQAHMVSVGYSLLTALLAGKVDAVVGVYWTWEAIQAQMKGYKVNVMRVERWGVPNYCELVLVANERTLRTPPGFVRGTVQALQQGYAYAEAHPAQAWNALHAADKTLDRTLVLTSLGLLRSAITDARTIGYQDGRQWQYYARWLAQNKLIARPVGAGQAFTDQFLQPGIR